MPNRNLTGFEMIMQKIVRAFLEDIFWVMWGSGCDGVNI